MYIENKLIAIFLFITNFLILSHNKAGILTL